MLLLVAACHVHSTPDIPDSGGGDSIVTGDTGTTPATETPVHYRYLALDGDTPVIWSEVSVSTAPDGKVTLVGETSFLYGEGSSDYTAYAPWSARVHEEAVIEADGRLLTADAQQRTTVAATELDKRLTLDGATAHATWTRPSGTLEWDIGTDEPLTWILLGGDAWWDAAVVTPVQAYVMSRAWQASATPDMVLPDAVFSALYPPDDWHEGSYSDGVETWTIRDGFVKKLDFAEGFTLLLVDDAVEIPAFSPPSVAHDRPPVAWPDCTLPGTAEMFTVTSGDGTVLAGEIDLPPEGPTGRVVVFDAGSGGSDRDEWLGGIPRWACLAHPLLDEGFAVVRYDTRGLGLSGGAWAYTTLRDREDDLRAVVESVAADEVVSGAGLFLLGHSEGVEHVDAVAPSIPEVDGLILLAGVGKLGCDTGGDIGGDQLRALMENYGFDQDDIESALAAHEAQIAALLDGSYTAEEFIGSFTVEYWLEVCAADGAALLAQNDVPVLIAQGDRDWQVDPENADLLAAAAAGAGMEVTQVRCPTCGHFLNPGVTDYPSTGDEYFLPIDWDEAVRDGIVGWLRAH